jgi:hypothetical protein
MLRFPTHTRDFLPQPYDRNLTLTSALWLEIAKHTVVTAKLRNLDNIACAIQHHKSNLYLSIS